MVEPHADPVLLSTAEMRQADHLTIAAGTLSGILLDRAGSAVAEHCAALCRAGLRGSVLVLCGPGNNGGDGIVAACRLRAKGVDVRLALLGSRESLSADAAAAARAWPGPFEIAAEASFDRVGLIVDALFGAGLDRAPEGDAAALIGRVNAAGIPVVAVDVPSGIVGDTGAAPGPAIRAQSTVTFFRLKPAHLLLPGRAHMGEVVLGDIGIDPAVLATIAPATFANRPSLWGALHPWPTADGHKYTRGHVVVVAGAATTSGAPRLSARGALRIGAGLVTVAAPADAMAVMAAQLTAVMLRAADGPDGLAHVLSDPRKNAVVLGPGLEPGEATRALVAQALSPGEAGARRATVLDAGALTSFAGQADALAGLIAQAPGAVVVTPHDGEFGQLFGKADQPQVSRLDRARAGAARLGAVMLLKGPDTVVAEPDGRASIAEADAPWLATAGSGDVLAGFVAGLLAQGMPGFQAASAAVYLHAAVAREVRFGLIAEDLPERLPGVLAALHAAIG